MEFKKLIKNFFGVGAGILCPYCLTEIRGYEQTKNCPKCTKELSDIYKAAYEQALPFFVQVFGWSQVGKTTFLYALTYLLTQLQNINSRVIQQAATDPTRRIVADINTFIKSGRLPTPTPLGEQEAYVMALRNLPRWGGRTLVIRDCAGEIFDSMAVPVEQAPYLLNAPIAFMFISKADLEGNGGRTMDTLLNNYVATLLRNGVKLKQRKHKLVVVLTKADLIGDLPQYLRAYLEDDVIARSIQSQRRLNWSDVEIDKYMMTLGQVSSDLRDWIARDASGQNFVNIAEDYNIETNFTLISSTGGGDKAGDILPAAWSPKRVLDPFFWALEMNSEPIVVQK